MRAARERQTQTERVDVNPDLTSQAAADADHAIGRRGLLRAGAVLAGAVAASTAGLAAADSAQAADGDAIRAGQANTATSTTTLTVGGDDGSADAALTLNNADGPALSLQALPADWAGELAVGDIAGGGLGPVVGVDSIEGPVTTYLATGMDLANIPTPFATTPSRRLDLRTSAGRASILRKSATTALGSDGKLLAGQWIDISIVPTGPDYTLEAVFANLTVVASVKGGYGVLYPPGVRPPTSSVNFSAKNIVANAAFVGAGSVLGFHAVRLYSSVDAWYVLDVNGGVTSGITQAPIGDATALRANGGRKAVINRLRQALSRLSR